MNDEFVQVDGIDGLEIRVFDGGGEAGLLRDYRLAGDDVCIGDVVPLVMSAKGMSRIEAVEFLHNFSPKRRLR